MIGLILIGAAVVLGVLLIAGISIHNSLVRRYNAVDQAFGTIDAQMIQRYDLVPKLVETARQYMQHERGVLEDVSRWRSQAATSTNPSDRIAADNELSRALGQLRVTVENYPQLRAIESFDQLQRSLNEVEAQLAAARRGYNAAVTSYHDAIQTFPSSIVAGMSGFHPRPMLAADERQRGDVNMRGLFDA